MRNPPIEIDAAEKYPHDKNRETREKGKPTQYLTRFDNLPTYSGQGERDFIDSTINTRIYKRDTLRDTIHEGSNPYL